MFKNITKRHPGESALDLVRRYIEQETPITITSEDRAQPITIPEPCPTSTPTSGVTKMTFNIGLLVIGICFNQMLLNL